MERNRMNKRIIASLTLITTISLATFLAIPETSAGGPATANMLIKIFTDPAHVENALSIGDIDINDWPLSSTFIANHASDPSITLNEYAGMDMFQFDMNNQLWPTGPTTTPRVGAKNSYFNPLGERDIAAWHFRRAIAHLANKAKVAGINFVLKCDIPQPFVPTPPSNLENATAIADAGAGGYTYPYDRVAAAQELDLGNFKDWDSDGFREWKSPSTGVIEEFPNMKFWIRLDYSDRRQAAEDLFNEMTTVPISIPIAAAAGAPGLDKRFGDRSTCLLNVMIAYDYNIYTGDWTIDSDIDFLFDLYHSSMGQYGYANNYPGFKNQDFDWFVERVKYAPTIFDAYGAAIEAQWVKAKYIPIIPLWSSWAVKGYRTGWDDALNEDFCGVDNFWSFLGTNWIDGTGTSRNGPDDTIVWGFSSDLSSLNVITSTALWDWKALHLIYDSLLDRNPYSFYEKTGRLATAWSATTTYPGWEGKTVCEFTVRNDATFHDGTPVKPADVAYSMLAVRDAGAGNGWNYPTMMGVDKVQIQGQVVRVFFSVRSVFALYWAGFLPIINKDLWNPAIGLGTASGYTGFIPDDTDGTYTGGTYSTPQNIRNYQPWGMDVNSNGIVDLREDGSGPWSFASYAVGFTVALNAFTSMYTTMSRGGTMIAFSDFLDVAFHEVGNVNYSGGYGAGAGWYAADRIVDVLDLGRIINSVQMRVTDPWGPGWNEYNPDADLNHDGMVGFFDLVTAAIHYYRSMG